jgi:hypothetical protein
MASKFDSSRESGLPPNKTTRLQLPDARSHHADMSQEDRKKAMYNKGSKGAFSKIGIVGPER